MFIILLLFLLHLGYTAAINRLLPKMNLVEHIYPQEVYKPSYKQEFRYQFSQSMFGQISISPTDPEYKLSDQCSFTPQLINTQHRETITNPYDHLQSPKSSSPSPSLLYLPSNRMLYSLNSDRILSIYNYSEDKTLTKQVSIKLYQQKQGGKLEPPHLLAAQNWTYIFIFCPHNNSIGFVLQTQSLGGNITPIKAEDINIPDRIIKVLELENRIYFLTNTSNIVVAEVSSKGGLKRVPRTKESPVAERIVDFDINQGMVFALGKTNNIYVYNISKTGLLLYDTILFSNTQNYKIKTQGNRIYVSFFNKSNAVIQLLYNITTKEAIFIRYYPTYRQSIKEFYLMDKTLMILVPNGVYLHQTNIDPRVIKRENSETRHKIKGNRITQMDTDHYLFSTPTHLHLYSISTAPPTLVCRAHKSSLFLSVTYSGIEKGCFNQKVDYLPFNYMCNSTRSLMIEIVEPKVFHHELLLSLMLCLYLVLIVLGCWRVKVWRDSKIRVIKNLEIEIDNMVEEEGEIASHQSISDTLSPQPQTPPVSQPQPTPTGSTNYSPFQSQMDISGDMSLSTKESNRNKREDRYITLD